MRFLISCMLAAGLAVAAPAAAPSDRASVAGASLDDRSAMPAGRLAEVGGPPAPAPAQAVQPGAWDVTSTVVDLSVPGVPGFLARMARGKTKAEHKRLSAGEGVDALLAPDPKARCRVEHQAVAGGRYAQSLTCPQKKGDPLRVERTGTYDASGFSGRATLAGTTPKGSLSIILDQRATRVGG